MFCPNCGHTLAADARFCTACGTAVAATQAASGEDPYRPPTSRTGESDTFELVYAGFWRRAGAAIVDSFIVGILIMVLLFAVILAVGTKGSEIIIGSAYLLLILCAPWLYFALMESSSGQATLGKKLVGVRVCDLDGQRISFARATGRHFGKYLSSLIFSIGYLMVAFTKRKQGLHDMVAGTLVIDPDAQGSRKGTPIGIIVAVVLAVGFVPFVGILAAIAIPAYQDYTVRSQMNEVLAYGEHAKSALESYYKTHQSIPPNFDLARDAGFNETSPYVGGVHVRDADAAIELGLSIRSIAGKHLLFVPSLDQKGELSWTCGSPDIPPRLLAERCRNVIR